MKTEDLVSTRSSLHTAPIQSYLLWKALNDTQQGGVVYIRSLSTQQADGRTAELWARLSYTVRHLTPQTKQAGTFTGPLSMCSLTLQVASEHLDLLLDPCWFHKHL